MSTIDLSIAEERGLEAMVAELSECFLEPTRLSAAEPVSPPAASS